MNIQITPSNVDDRKPIPDLLWTYCLLPSTQEAFFTDGVGFTLCGLTRTQVK